MLSILICSIETREHYYRALKDCLNQQLRYRNDVELLTIIDNGEMSIGKKRNELAKLAKGDYSVFIDDDDLVSNDYVSRIVEALQSNPDAVGFRMARYRDGEYIGYSRHSMYSPLWSGKPYELNGDKVWDRFITHINPVRTDLMQSTPFPEINSGEDIAYAQRLRNLVKSEIYIDRPLYYYYYRSMERRLGEVTNRSSMEQLAKAYV